MRKYRGFQVLHFLWGKFWVNKFCFLKISPEMEEAFKSKIFKGDLGKCDVYSLGMVFLLLKYNTITVLSNEIIDKYRNLLIK